MRHKPGELIHYHFETTPEPLPDPVVDALPLRTQQKLADIHQALREDPASQVTKLERLCARCPDVPRIENFLAVAYRAAGRDEQADALIRRTYERFPDYLFAIANYLVVLICDGQLDEADRVIGGRYVIAARFPGRKVFHDSEVITYTCAVGLLLAARGQLEDAIAMHESLVDMGYDHPMMQRLAGAIEFAALEGMANEREASPPQAWKRRPPRRSKPRAGRNVKRNRKA